jgi:hypothetical protein
MNHPSEADRMTRSGQLRHGLTLGTSSSTGRSRSTDAGVPVDAPRAGVRTATSMGLLVPDTSRHGLFRGPRASVVHMIRATAPASTRGAQCCRPSRKDPMWPADRSHNSKAPASRQLPRDGVNDARPAGRVVPVHPTSSPPVPATAVGPGRDGHPPQLSPWCGCRRIRVRAHRPEGGATTAVRPRETSVRHLDSVDFCDRYPQMFYISTANMFSPVCHVGMTTDRSW